MDQGEVCPGQVARHGDGATAAWSEHGASSVWAGHLDPLKRSQIINQLPATNTLLLPASASPVAAGLGTASEGSEGVPQSPQIRPCLCEVSLARAFRDGPGSRFYPSSLVFHLQLKKLGL